MIVLTLVYGLLALVAVTNWLLMVRAPSTGATVQVAFLIPARNEATNLPHLLPKLAGSKVYVFDDDSTDGTADIARAHGATVIARPGPLPDGWTGKNRACHELAKVAAEDFAGEWIVFLDADVRPTEGFVTEVGRLIHQRGRRYPVISAMPTLIPGSAAEAAYMNWVVWLILATNPFGLVARSGRGHNMFLNGQFVAWRMTTYMEIQPHSEMRGAILEDVRIGRLLARRNVPVLIANLNRTLHVRMYESFAQALNGMSKNSYEIAGSMIGSLGIALLMFVIAWAWLPALVVHSYAPLVAFAIGCGAVHGAARRPVWTYVFWPFSITLGAFTFCRSILWHQKGTVEWKGRSYSGAARSGRDSAPSNDKSI